MVFLPSPNLCYISCVSQGAFTLTQVILYLLSVRRALLHLKCYIIYIVYYQGPFILIQLYYLSCVSQGPFCIDTVILYLLNATMAL